MFDFPLPPFLISVLFHKQQHSHEALIIAPRVSISSRKKSCLIPLNVLQLYSILCTGQSISLTAGWMIIGRVLRTLKGFLGQYNRSYWPRSGDNTLSSCFFSVCLSLSHTNRGFLRMPMSEVWSGREIKTYLFIHLRNLYVYSFSTSVTVLKATEICNSSAVWNS